MTKPKSNAREIATGATDEEAKVLMEEVYLQRMNRAFDIGSNEAEHLECDLIVADALRTLGWLRLSTKYTERRKVRGWWYA